MINVERFNEILTEYKSNFHGKHWEKEKFKWESVKWFQDNWDIDASDFGAMFLKATEKTETLLVMPNTFPRGMICGFAEADPEAVRTMFINLYDESVDLSSRIETFISDSETLREKYNDGTWKNHFQNTNFISIYLWHMFPDKYYIYKYSTCKTVALELGSDFIPQKGKIENLIGGKALYDEICELLKQDDEMLSILKNCLTDSCYNDPELKILTIDFCFYISKYLNINSSVVNEDGWWPSLDEYNPSISTEEWIDFLTEDSKTYPLTLKMFATMLELGGQATCKKLSEVLGGHPSTYISRTTGFGERVKKHFNLPPCMDGDKERFFPVAFLGRSVEGTQLYAWKLRPELRKALEIMDLSFVLAMNEEGEEVSRKTDVNKNTIIYGPPGTGKTYNTVVYAVAIVENKPLAEVKKEKYSDVLKRYNEYKADGLIEFTTFHQSYGYEEFIEGIKPVVEADEDEDISDVRYTVADGVFKRFCDKAKLPVHEKSGLDIGLNKSPTIWKVSLEGTGDNDTRKECLESGHIRIGWDDYGEHITDNTDFNIGGKKVLNAFLSRMRIGDIVFSCYSATTIDAIGIVTGEYEWHDEYDKYKRVRKVNWIAKGIKEDIVEVNNGATMTLATVYCLKNISITDALEIIQKYLPQAEETKNRVFIIDEINRGNISKIFGELITLIDPTKREGAEEELKVILPYSQKLFGVPDNVYLLGTMNTADRSIAALDTALRRRFGFVEMMPDDTTLKGVNIEGVEIDRMLEKMNKRISALFDREHTIGHAYFIGLKDNETIDALGEIFRNKIIPLLQEYFFEDYEKIRLVLADNQTEDREKQFVVSETIDVIDLFGNADEVDIDSVDYHINDDAFKNKEAYLKIYK